MNYESYLFRVMYAFNTFAQLTPCKEFDAYIERKFEQ